LAGGRRSFEAFGEAGGERPIGRKRRRRMTLRGRLTLGVPIAAVLFGGWLAGPGRGTLADAARWLEPPAELRLARVEAPPPELPWAPDSVLGRLPVSQEAFRLAQASADWLPKDQPPGARLWESLAAPPERPDLVTPLRVEYTLNPALTERVFGVLERSHVDLGHVIVMDPATEEVLVYASTDLDRFPPTSTYPAASLIKVVTAAAALEHSPGAALRPCRFDGSPYRLTASRVNPPRGRGTEVSLTKALATSNNQCFAQLAVHEVGATSLLDVIRRFGILEAPGPMHSAGSAADPGQDPFALGQLGCGLAGCRITPLQAARMAGVLADGQLDHPRWISRVVDGSGRDLPLPDLGEPRRVLSPKLAAKMREMMVETTVRGTARRAFHPRGRPLVPGVRVAGKTGSLSGRDPDGRYEWFIGVAPADKPRVAVAVVVVQGTVWHRTASQVSADVFHTLFCDDRGGSCTPNGIGRWLPTTSPPPALPPVRAAAATGAAR
jgi:peptidoglycan glycosyltransferase